MQYRFYNFLLDTDEKALSWSGKPVTLTSKTYDILLVFVQSQGNLVSRDQLIEEVWNGRFVTDNTLDQNLYRLRKTLSSHEPGKYIEAVYGQGLRFLPAVVEGAPPADEAVSVMTPGRQKVKPAVFGPAVVGLAVLGLAVILWWSQYGTDSELPGSLQPPTDNPGWTGPDANVGEDGQTQEPPVSISAYRFYLEDLLSELLSHSPYQVQSDSSVGNEKAEFVVTITGPDDKRPQQNVEIRFRAPEGNADIRASVVLIREGVQQELMSYSNQEMLPVFSRLVQALEDALQLEARQERVGIYLPESEAVLRSHLEATAARMRGESALANQKAQFVTDTAPDFPLAWYELALSYRSQGELDKALAVLSAVKPSGNPRFSYRMDLLHAQVLDQLGKIEEAEQRYNAMFDMASSLDDDVKMASVRISQGIMYRKAGDYQLARAYLDEARTMLSIEEQPGLFGTWANTQARLDKITGDNKAAMEHAMLAATAFRQAGHVKHEMASSNLAASLLLARREHAEAERLIKATLFTNERIGNVRGQCDNLFILAGIYQHSGRLDLARQRWDEVIRCTQSLELTGREAEAYLEATRTAIAQRKPNDANTYFRFLQTLAQEQGDEELLPYTRQAEVELAIFNQADDQLQALLDKAEDLPGGYTDYYRGVAAGFSGDLPLAEALFGAGLNKLPPGAGFDLYLLYLDGLNRIYAATDPEKLRDNLALCLQYNPSAYPFKKYQALVALHDDNSTRARQLLEEMKLEAPEQWWPEDAQLLEQARQDANALGLGGGK